MYGISRMERLGRSVGAFGGGEGGGVAIHMG